MKSRWLLLALTVSLCLLTSSLAAQEKEQKGEGEIKFGVHKYKLEAGFIYDFEVVGQGFVPEAQISGGSFLGSFRRGRDDRREIGTFRGVFIPEQNAEHTVIVSPKFLAGSGGGKDTLKYSIAMKPMKLEEKPLLTKEDAITAEDPVFADKAIGRGNTHFKSYEVKLKAEQICVISINPKKQADKGGSFAPMLFIESSKKQYAMASGGGNNGNVVLVFRAPADSEYRIVATGFKALDLGEYSLSVRTVK